MSIWATALRPGKTRTEEGTRLDRASTGARSPRGGPRGRRGAGRSIGRGSLRLSGNTDRPLLATLKRLIDLSCALGAVILLLPVLIACAVMVRMSGKGPIFYRQERVGEGGRRFDIMKFRTMHVNAHLMREQLREQSIQDGPAFKIPNDPRITRVGGFLRKTSLDELPQIINVIRGEMSIVGPRPTSFAASTYDLWHSERLEVMPGITGLWQIKGRGTMTFDERLRLDIEYIERRSILLDLRLIAETALAVFKGSGV